MPAKYGTVYCGRPMDKACGKKEAALNVSAASQPSI
jgi:hypothetical protein